MIIVGDLSALKNWSLHAGAVRSRYIVAMAVGIDRGWLDASKFSAVVEHAWSGLSTQILESGLVEGICDVRIPFESFIRDLRLLFI